MSRKVPVSLLERFWKASRIPFGFAVVFSAYAVVRYMRATPAETDYGPPLQTVLAVYILSALGVGIIIALFGRWATTRTRGALLGFCAGALFAIVLNFAFLPLVLEAPLFGLKLAFLVVVTGCYPGAFLGALFWEPPEMP